MASLKPPVVFLGPSVPVAAARKILPQAEFCSPAARGDLYRARFFNASIIVFIDGVFHERQAPSPREVVDVARDGARLLGASSLGAIRAAECWPAGVRGAGAIYRLYRAGRLHSDDEVALVFDPQSGRPLSVPLINIRHATRRAVRTGLLRPVEGLSIIEIASRLFYADRTWNEVLALASLPIRPHVRKFLESQDLKRRDALHALAIVRRWIEREPGLVQRYARRSSDPFQFIEHVREPAADPLLGLDLDQTRQQLTAWLLATGRYRRYANCLTAQATAASRQAQPHQLESQPLAHETELILGLRERRLRLAALAPLLGDLDAFAIALWRELQISGELHAEVFRWAAMQEFANGDETPSSMDRYRAGLGILAEHGMETWGELQAWAEKHSLPTHWFEEARRKLEKAQCAIRAGGDPRKAAGGAQ